jgi:hypothetical protein
MAGPLALGLMAFGHFAQAADAGAAHQLENVGRSMVASRRQDVSVFVSWRLRATDPDLIAFNL